MDEGAEGGGQDLKEGEKADDFGRVVVAGICDCGLLGCRGVFRGLEANNEIRLGNRDEENKLGKFRCDWMWPTKYEEKQRDVSGAQI